MLEPLYIARMTRADLLRTRSMAAALARNLDQVLANADCVVPFALSRFDDLLADDVLRLLGCLRRAHALNDRLGEDRITGMALRHDRTGDTAPTPASQAPN